MVQSVEEGVGPASRGEQQRGNQLSAGELKSMLGQCLQMASENKITAHNTWGLPLIEHLDDLIQEEGAVRRTNFQKASVTLDAGVKIYSYRVDSVHTETFKMLGGLGRAGIDGSEGADGGDGGTELGEGGVGAKSLKKKRRGDLQPEATLESSLEALNVKKFDLAFAVDPLFHKTSAQFDEGGAHGLLLNNLSVYKGCNIVFDSMDIPDRAVGDAALEGAVDVSPLSMSHSAACVREEIDGIVGLLERNELEHARIAPVLDDITNIASIANASNPSSGIVKSTYPARELVARALQAAEAGAEGGCRSLDDLNSMFAAMHVPETLAAAGDIIDSAGMDDNGDMGGTDGMDGVAGDVGGYDDYGYDGGDYDQGGHYGRHDRQDALGEEAIHWLMHAGEDSRLENTKNMSWTGASHWRYRMTADASVNGSQSRRSQASRTTSTARNVPEPLDFTILMDMDDPPRIELETKRRKRAEKKTTAPDDSKTLLPEDFKYAISTLGKYNLRKEYIAILRRGSRGGYGNGANRLGEGSGGILNNSFDDNDDGFDFGPSDPNGAFSLNENNDDDWTVGNKTGNMELAQAAHKVEQIEVSYCKAAKQVDVKALKELMWRGITIVAEQRAEQGIDNPHDDIHFSDVLATVPADNHAGRLEDLSVHLCFICVLHLANEHGLVIQGVDSLDGLIISNVPLVGETRA